MEIIQSIKDPRVIAARELTSSKNRMSSKSCLLEGIEHISWALQAAIPIAYAFIHDKALSHPFVEDLKKANVPVLSVSDGILKKITDTNYLVLFVGVASLERLFRETKEELVLLMDDLVDHGNIGTIIRTGAAFDIHDIAFTNCVTDPFFKKTIDASRGTVFSSHFNCFESGTHAVEALKKQGYQIIATSPYGKTIQNLAQIKQQPVALVIGNETKGCSDEILEQADLVVQIPMSSDVESLNVAIAAGISIYDLRLKMIMAMIVQKIKGTLGRNMGVAAQLIRQALDKELQKVSTVSSSQMILLMILACDRTMTIKHAARDLGIDDVELTNLIRPLIEAGSIKKEVIDQEDGIAILPHGEELIAKLWPIRQRVDEKILENFSESEKGALQEMLKRIQDNCEKILAD